VSKIFISHSSVNNAAALAVAKWLADTGWAEYFLDINPSRGLAPGERWQEALKSAADRCEAVLFLVSPAWQTSRWCLAEFLLAKQLGKTIFGVLVEATPLEALPREMTAEWQLCDLVTGTARPSSVCRRSRSFRTPKSRLPTMDFCACASGCNERGSTPPACLATANRSEPRSVPRAESSGARGCRRFLRPRGGNRARP